MRATRHAFTLIELLVVITIIVVLLALLTPALDKAIHRAELAVCASNQDGIVTSAIQYAMDHKRQYPPRANTGAWQVSQIISPAGTQDLNGKDLRPVLRGHFSFESFNDPLCKGVDYEAATVNDYTYASYELWFGFFFFADNGVAQGGMRKYGDKLTWVYPASQPDPSRYRLDVMVSDWDFQILGGVNQSWSSHPDSEGRSSNIHYQSSGIGPAAGATLGNPNANYTLSLWITPGGTMRSPMELNAAFQDGSVKTYDSVEWKEDGRMVSLPPRNNAPNTLEAWINAPLR